MASQSPKTTCSYDTTMLTSRLSSGQRTSSCGSFECPHLLPENGDSEHATSVSSVRNIEYEQAKRGTSINEFFCRSPHCCNCRATTHRKPSSFRYCNKYVANSPILTTSMGNIYVTEEIDSNYETQASCGTELRDIPSSRNGKNRTKFTWNIIFETWFSIGLLFCFMFIGFAHLHLRIRELEEQNVELKHFKSNVNLQEDHKTKLEHFKIKVNMLEQLVKGLNEAHSKQSMQNILKSTTDTPMSVTLPKESQLLPVFTRTTIRPTLRGDGLSRVKRNTLKPTNNPMPGLMKSVLDGYCNTKSVDGSCKQMILLYRGLYPITLSMDQSDRNLDFVVFQAVFNQSVLTHHRFNGSKDSKVDPDSVPIGGEWPVIMKVGHIITYLLEGAPLNIYQTYVHQTVNSSSVLIESTEDFKSFLVKTTGLYTVHFSIVILDEAEKNINEYYIGLYVNNKAVLACLGFRCSENLPDSNKIRICSMNGIFHLNNTDQIQLKTMKSNTEIRIEEKRNSEITFVLLHKTKT